LHKLLILFIFFTVSLFALELTQDEQNYLKTKKHLKVMSLKNFQPFNFRDKGEFLGYSVERMKLIGNILNKELIFVNKPWATQLEMLKNKQLDIIPHIAVTEKRKKFVTYTNFTHLNFSTGFAINKNYDISTMKDFNGKKIAVVNKHYLHDYLTESFPNIQLLITSSTQEAVQAVADNRAFAVIDNIPTLNYFIQDRWHSNLKIDTVNDFGLPLEMNMPMGVSKGNELLKSILEKANSSISYQETLKLKRDWLNDGKNDKKKSTLTKDEFNYLKEKKKILMCVLPNALPFEQIDEKGKHKGISADIIEIISKFIDTPIELIPTKTWTESLSNIKDRKCDILPIAMDLPERKLNMDFTKSYITEPFVIVTKDTQLFIKDSKDLDNKKIGSVRSYAFASVLKAQNPLIDLVEVKNSKDGLKRVQSGELFGYIDTIPVIGYMIQKYSMLDLKIAGKLEFDINLAIASRNDEPILSSIMQKALDTISEDRKRTIIGKWISIKIAQEFDYTVLWQITGVFFLILILILYKNDAVRKVNKKLINANKEIAEQQNMVDKYVLILTTDLKGIITQVNEAYCKVIGFSKDEIIGNSHSMMKHPEMKKEFFKMMWKDIKSNKIWNGEIKNLTKNGKSVCFYVNIEPIFKNDKKIGYRSVSENITDKKKIEKLSITDQLTQLYNRHKLEESFMIEISRVKRYKDSLSMILLDIDHFKSVNDKYGHDIGDETLKSISQILTKSVRITDIVGRWGGEEFILIVPNTNLEQTKLLAEKIRKVVEVYSFKEIGHITVSLGISTFFIDDTKESLVKRADEALYRAKKNGRNRVEVI